MQIDMHYYGTYVLARAAGLDREFATRVATAAQLVDDYDKNMSEPLDDGSMLLVHPSAHGVTDFKNLDTNDQRLVWVPFHFLPGGIGDTFFAQLDCRADSLVAGEMLDNTLKYAEKGFFPELVGVAAHVYADTWSHAGFSGIRNERNRISMDSIQFDAELSHSARKRIEDKLEQAQANFKANAADITGLGHAGVAECPDRPFLKWSYEWEDQQEREQLVARNNPALFLSACEGLFGYFQRVAAVSGQGKALPFASIQEAIAEILAHDGDKDSRAEQWIAAVGRGKPFLAQGEDLPHYMGGVLVSRFSDVQDASAMQQHPLFPFLLAVEAHRTYVLRDLLPSHGLLVA